ncbi:STAS domain-containing protein [Streptomyces sp. NPDC096136]|uniref:STAS domain-containing protein n=1 Tax=Streptomyces sp. NPDC096136 TaxID=3366076 RepID=UPI00381CC8B9
MAEFSTRQVGDLSVTVVDVTGTLACGATGTGALTRVVAGLLEEGRTRIVVNLVEVTEADQHGFRELADCYVLASRGGARLRLAAFDPQVRELLAAGHLGSIFEVFGSEEAAVGSFV